MSQVSRLVPALLCSCEMLSSKFLCGFGSFLEIAKRRIMIANRGILLIIKFENFTVKLVAFVFIYYILIILLYYVHVIQNIFPVLQKIKLLFNIFLMNITIKTVIMITVIHPYKFHKKKH